MSGKIIKCLILFLFLPVFCLNAQRNEEDSLEHLLKQSQSSKEKFRITRELINVCADHDVKKTIALCEHLYLSGLTGGEKPGGEFYEWAGLYCLKSSKYEKSKIFFGRAILQYRYERNSAKIMECLAHMGYIMYIIGDYGQGMKLSYLNLKMIEISGYRKLLPMTYNNLGLLERSVDNYERSIEFFMHSVEIAPEFGDTLSLATALNEIGNNYMLLNEYDIALNFMKKSLFLKLENPINNGPGIVYSYNDLAGFFYRLEEYDSTIYYLNKALIADSANMEPRSQAIIYSNIGECYTLRGKTKEAMESFMQALKFSKQANLKSSYQGIYEGLSSANASMGNHKQAYDYLKLSLIYKDSIFNLENQKQINELRTIYETEKKDKEILLLNMETEKQAEKQRKQIIIIISVIAGLLLVSAFAVFAFRQKVRIKKEKKRSDELLLNILPSETAEELKAKGFAEPRHFDMVTVMFTDFKGFTGIAEKMSAGELVAELHYCFKNYDEIITKYQIEKIKTIGDSYMCAGGLPVPNVTNAEDVIRAALDIQHFMNEYRERRQNEGKPFFDIRIGIHTGPIVAGIVGIKKFSYDIWGDTVNIASRMESSGEAGKINISVATYELVKEKFICEYRGEIDAKGKGKIKMYFILGLMAT